jgi:hypothetical protein
VSGEPDPAGVAREPRELLAPLRAVVEAKDARAAVLAADKSPVNVFTPDTNPETGRSFPARRR